MNLSDTLGALDITFDYNRYILKNLLKLFRSYQLHNTLCRQVEALLLSNKDVPLSSINNIQRTSIESMIESGFPDAGFALGKMFHIESFGGFNVALQSAPDLAQAVILIARYTPQFEAILQLEFCDQTRRLYVEFDKRLSTSDWQYEDALMACWQMLKQLVAVPLTPEKVAIKALRPDYADAYRQELNVEVEFGASRTYIQLSPEDWAYPMRLPSAQITALFGQWFSHESKEDTAWLIDVYRLIYRNLSQHSRPLSLPLLAQQRHCSIATMKRHLKKHGKSFTQMKDEVAMLISYHFLARTTLPIYQVAVWLNFSDSANFCRACKRWFGVTPKTLRATAQQSHQLTNRILSEIT
ncbi:AraC family transcriptional regulator [Vibrio hangzhouensis]|uniref:AraC family transcriptional regulator n=1 Tax=Vibrio hangzhouensis TaxID=462991 RepID=UPI001C98CBE4|nr:AraC family transcriptional regulator [Vibrio hangzhouensis]MBY6198263.1 AraC family transcriptional regulator [Vibrio hangzhouensis]